MERSEVEFWRNNRKRLIIASASIAVIFAFGAPQPLYDYRVVLYMGIVFAIALPVLSATIITGDVLSNRRRRSLSLVREAGSIDSDLDPDSYSWLKRERLLNEAIEIDPSNFEAVDMLTSLYAATVQSELEHRGLSDVSELNPKYKRLLFIDAEGKDWIVTKSNYETATRENRKVSRRIKNLVAVDSRPTLTLIIVVAGLLASGFFAPTDRGGDNFYSHLFGRTCEALTSGCGYSIQGYSKGEALDHLESHLRTQLPSSQAGQELEESCWEFADDSWVAVAVENDPAGNGNPAFVVEFGFERGVFFDPGPIGDGEAEFVVTSQWLVYPPGSQQPMWHFAAWMQPNSLPVGFECPGTF